MDTEKIQDFADMVNATQKLSEPWQKSCFHMKIILAVTNLLWAIALITFIAFAYLTPSEITTGQNQDFSNQTQNYTSTVTDGK